MEDYRQDMWNKKIAEAIRELRERIEKLEKQVTQSKSKAKKK